MSLDNPDDLEDLVILSESLGEGGFGTVFMSELGGKKVASKKLKHSKQEYDKLVSEASNIRRLQHGKHIAYTYGITMKDDNLYMVMEYSEGGDLQNYLKRNKELITHKQKIIFCRGILLGLLYCHSMEVFHGDIKCSNVILGKNLEPKLTDFGLSVAMENMDCCKIYEGSVCWAAPELFSMKEESDFEEFKTNPYPTDVYSLGATFCEISYDGTTDFINSDDPPMDIMLGLVFPTPKDQFLEGVIKFCCCYKRNERITLDTCLVVLDITAEDELSDSATDNEWPRIQQSIQANSEFKLSPSFSLQRPADNLVVGPSNLSLLEWLCINDYVDAVKHMIQLHKLEEKQVDWLCSISMLCGSPNVTEALCKQTGHKDPVASQLLNLIDENPWQFIESLIKAGADCKEWKLLKMAIETHYNLLVQAIVKSGIYLHDWFVYEAIKAKNIEAVRIFAIAGVGLEHIDRNGNTPLHLAIDTGNVEAVKFLLDFSVNVNSKNQHTLLYRAALNGNKEIAALLINAGTTVDTKSEQWQTLLQNSKSESIRSTMQFIIDNMGKKDMNSVKKSSLLCRAIRDDEYDFVEDLIGNKADVNERDCDGFAPLHLAVLVGDEKIVKALIGAGADIEIRTPKKDQRASSSSKIFCKCTPLHIAIEAKCLEIARLLIGLGADFSKRNGSEQTIMEMVAEEDRKELENIILEFVRVSKDFFGKILSSISPEVIKKLIDKKETDNDLLSDFLCFAAKHGNEEIVKYLVEHRADINWICEDKNPLEWAILGNQAQIVEILIEKGADVNTRGMYSRTPLFLCVKKLRIKIMQFLVDRGADVNIRDTYGDAPIHFATNIEVAEALIEAGAKVDAVGRYNETALIRCVEASKTEMVDFLIKKRANVNIKNAHNKTPIFFAENLEVVEILVKASANVNEKDGSGRTPLFHFVERSHTEIVQFLASKGADVNTRDRNGRTPLFHFVKKSHTKMVQFLVDNKADTNAKDNNENVPFHFTRTGEIAKILIDNGADVEAKDRRGRQLREIWIDEENKNLIKKNNDRKKSLSEFQKVMAQICSSLLKSAKSKVYTCSSSKE